MATKQNEMPLKGEGVEVKRIAAIDKAADEYTDIRDKRMTLTEEEVAKRQTVINLMQKHGLTKYIYDGHVVELDKKDLLKVKPVKDSGE